MGWEPRTAPVGWWPRSAAWDGYGDGVGAKEVLWGCVQPCACLGVAFSFYTDFTVNNAGFSFPSQNSYKQVFLICLKYILLANVNIQSILCGYKKLIFSLRVLQIILAC